MTGEADGGEGGVRFRCADAARERGDPQFATAPPAPRWLLVEHPGPWGRQALADSGFAPGVIGALDTYCRTEGARFQLIRRPRARGWSTAEGGRFAVADTRPGAESVRWGRVADPADLPAALADPAATTRSDEPVYLVCAHGRHDACCAMRGRPVAAALAAGHPDRAWETTHTGGDRFAANTVLLPHGLVLGGVPATEALEVVADYDKGEVDPVRVRGRSSLSPPAQAAQHHARLTFDEPAVDALLPHATEQLGPDLWAVELDGGPGRGPVRVVLRERFVSAGTPLTCSASGPAPMRTYDLVELAAGPDRTQAGALPGAEASAS